MWQWRFGRGHWRNGDASPHLPIAIRRSSAELLIDCEGDRTLRAVLVGILREAERGRYGASGLRDPKP